ncbi:MAG: hypothetical protein ABJA34_06430 [Pseudonocardiales bacterium]
MSTPASNVWYLATPPPMVPLPAASVSPLKKRRIIIGAGHGFRYDMIAGAEPHTGADGRSHVNVLSEYDQYRAGLTNTDVSMHPVPLEYLWIEARRTPTQQPPADGGRMIYDWELLQDPTAPPEDHRPPGEPDELFRRLVTLDSPPVRTPKRASSVESLAGRRLILVNPGEFLYDSRAISEPYQSTTGDVCVNVASAKAWYDWAATGHTPPALAWPIERVWVD